MKLQSSLGFAAMVTTFAFGFAAKPVDAASSSCWYGESGRRMERFDCDVNRRVNANGHVVWDVATPQKGRHLTFVLWGHSSDTAGVADLIVKNRSVRIHWHKDRDGDIRLTNHQGAQLAVRFPGQPSVGRAGGGVMPAGAAYGDMFQR